VDVTVRVATVGDAARIAEVHLRSALDAFAHIFPPDAPAPTIADLTRAWERRLGEDRPPGQVGFVAEDAGVLIGVAVAGPDPDDPRVGHLSRLYVVPSHRGRGIGRTLYERAMVHLRSRAYRDATLWVLEGNERARRWYESLGWHVTTGRKPTYAPAGIDDVRYWIALNAVGAPP
jgi:ribosomal protein S18 acetylase RimI-like enzyme